MIIPLTESDEFPRLVFDHEVHADDLAPIGFRGDVCVELSNGESFPVYFMEPRAVQEELVARTKHGFAPCVTEPGLVIVDTITVAAMKAVVLELIKVGHFNHFKPLPTTAATKPVNPRREP